MQCRPGFTITNSINLKMNSSIKTEVKIAVLSCTGPNKGQLDLLSDLRHEYTGCYGDFDKDLDEMFRALLANADSAGFACADLIRYYATVSHAKQLFRAFVVPL